MADTGESTRAKYFGEAHPERYFNVGIAEQHMVGMAVGLALAGFKPFAVTFAAFLMRAWEQIRNAVARVNANVKLVGTHSGFTDAYDGPSHQALEDIALMRVLPNMTVVAPADGCETYWATKAVARVPGPVYLRVGRDYNTGVTCENEGLEIGKGYIYRDGTDVAILSTGQTLALALEAADILSDRGISTAVVHFPTIKPLDRQLLISTAKKTGAIVVVEEHMRFGGFGSAVAEELSQTYPIPMVLLGVETFGKTARDPAELYRLYGLTPEEVANRAEELVRVGKKR